MKYKYFTFEVIFSYLFYVIINIFYLISYFYLNKILGSNKDLLGILYFIVFFLLIPLTPAVITIIFKSIKVKTRYDLFFFYLFTLSILLIIENKNALGYYIIFNFIFLIFTCLTLFIKIIKINNYWEKNIKENNIENFLFVNIDGFKKYYYNKYKNIELQSPYIIINELNSYIIEKHLSIDFNLIGDEKEFYIILKIMSEFIKSANEYLYDLALMGFLEGLYIKANSDLKLNNLRSALHYKELKKGLDKIAKTVYGF